jgi:DNA-binding GntR family transcriptional regulator
VDIAEAVAAGAADLAEHLMVEHIATTQSQFESKIRDRLFSPGAQPPSPETPAS